MGRLSLVYRLKFFFILIIISFCYFSKDWYFVNFKKIYISRAIYKENRQQTIHNLDKYGNFNNDSLIIVVQVHDRILYLEALIKSLSQTKDISKVLLIFSHDYFNDDINKLIQEIQFCKVMQIFYPYSIQLNPNKFPGTHPNDCPKNIKKAKAIELGCNNALFPDKYGHYRDANLTQVKHHWWWKANRVFNELEVTKNFQGYVAFLEEDHIVAEDFVYMFNVLKNVSSNCQNCNVLTLGGYLNKMPSSIYNEIIETFWVSTEHNMGFAFNRSTWNDIHDCDHAFCTYGDYNWDFSLQYISNNCLKSKLYTMTVNAPRVFHIGKCGIHHSASVCSPDMEIEKIQTFLKKKHNNGQLFPNNTRIQKDRLAFKAAKINPNGGWGEKLDIELCMKISLLSKAQSNCSFNKINIK